MLTFLSVLACLLLLALGLAPLIRENRLCRLLPALDLILTGAGFLCCLAARLLLTAGERNAEAAFIGWAEDLFALNAKIVLPIALTVAVLLTVSFLLTPDRLRAVRRLLPFAAASVIVLIGGTLAAMAENDGPVAADRLVMLFGLGAALLTAAGWTAEDLRRARAGSEEEQAAGAVKRRKGKKRRR